MMSVGESQPLNPLRVQAEQARLLHTFVQLGGEGIFSQSADVKSAAGRATRDLLRGAICEKHFVQCRTDTAAEAVALLHELPMLKTPIAQAAALISSSEITLAEVPKSLKYGVNSAIAAEVAKQMDMLPTDLSIQNRNAQIFFIIRRATTTVLASPAAFISPQPAEQTGAIPATIA